MGEKEQRRKKEEKDGEEGIRGDGGMRKRVIGRRRTAKDKMEEMIEGIKRGWDDTKPEHEIIREEEDELKRGRKGTGKKRRMEEINLEKYIKTKNHLKEETMEKETDGRD